METIRIIDRTETIIESVVKDIITFVFIAFCIYISRGSTWWTFVTGLMFIFGLMLKLHALTYKNGRAIKTRKELNEWANTMKWPDES